MTSRLSQMQARFQQKQMQEKEEKLLKLYEHQQQRAIERVNRGSAGSNGTATNIATGKVRQMFDERRQKAGIDRSYPLEPLAKTMPLPNRKSTLNHKIISAGAKKLNHNNNNNNSIEDEAEKYLSEHDDLVQIMNNHNLDDEAGLDGEEMPRIGFDDLDIFTGKLANVGGKLPSETMADTKKKEAAAARNNITQRNVVKPPLRKPVGATTRKQPAPATPKQRVDSAGSEQPSPASSKESSPAHSPAKKPATPSPVPSPSSSGDKMRDKVRAQGGDASKGRTPSTTRQSARAINPPSVQRDDLAACRYCQRRFAADRIGTHEDICSRTAKKKRKTYDATKHRVAGTEVEPYARKGTKQTKAKPASGKSNWRQKHEEFIAAIRAAKEAQAHVARGGNLRDLPPPPPSSNPDYVQCPHCGRRFNEAAASRHIPKCATYQFNKPKGKK